VLHNDLRIVDLELISVEYDFFCAVLDIDVDLDNAMIAESTTELEVIERYGIIRGL
jgi:hypothetical protein